jgi:outer membrane murein-binding lipoprotein Lpp
VNNVELKKKEKIMGQQSDTMEALYEETKHLKKLLEKCTELSALVAGDLASIPITAAGCISTSAIEQHWHRMHGERGDLAKLTGDIAALGGEIDAAKETALYAIEKLDARIKGPRPPPGDGPPQRVAQVRYNRQQVSGVPSDLGPIPCPPKASSGPAKR